MALKTGKKKTEDQETINYEVEVTRAKEFTKKDKTSYAFDMKVNGVSVYGCWLQEGKEGNFVSFPSYKGSDGNYYSHCYFPIDEELQAKIEEQIEAKLK